ncbi:Rieske (2Fe-2S) protein [Mucisphaera calidilacus]|uniref:Anthranilate 1,2-dioxygenase ferredoxin subunit n=1 Tax=Mucisphaera calidilacus TaxID=2527982 RepID=A0A518BYN6_9BACT|nr:Rieske (2Fe-2S) protein [Mucisphaera calidilacus]QDU72083.1 Anthranilate 1,2-dioxygenase ferredoxin subunit [Mucisphaera calidilacus]
MANWTPVGPAADVPESCQQACSASEHSVVVFRIDGQLHAIENLCPHAGLPLEDGEREGMVLTCPYHGFAFNLRTGANVDDPHDAPVRTLPARENNGQIEVDLDALKD